MRKRTMATWDDEGNMTMIRGAADQAEWHAREAEALLSRVGTHPEPDWLLAEAQARATLAIYYQTQASGSDD